MRAATADTPGMYFVVRERTWTRQTETGIYTTFTREENRLVKKSSREYRWDGSQKLDCSPREVEKQIGRSLWWISPSKNTLATLVTKGRGAISIGLKRAVIRRKYESDGNISPVRKIILHVGRLVSNSRTDGLTSFFVAEKDGRSTMRLETTGGNKNGGDSVARFTLADGAEWLEMQ